MKKGIIGKKLGMTQIFAEDGSVIPVTVIEAGPCPIAQKKTVVFGYILNRKGIDVFRFHCAVVSFDVSRFSTGRVVPRRIGIYYRIFLFRKRYHSESPSFRKRSSSSKTLLPGPFIGRSVLS